ncbi:MAG: Metallothiol transferase FosB [Phycisphaerae bacterium]|nr:Metallothiol transferase FosB [Phycisphaerae bacterium]
MAMTRSGRGRVRDARVLAAGLMLASTAATLSSSGAVRSAGPPRLPRVAVESVESVGFTVLDLDRSISFFRDVLTFDLEETAITGGETADPAQPVDPRTRVARMTLGDERLLLTEYVELKGRPFPADSRSNDLWFQHVAIIVSDMDRAYARLREHGVTPASRGGPQTLPDWNRNAGGIRAFYFRDPDGHFLEILQFPPDKGDPRWHARTDRLFLGIDHTAIVVSDTEASLRFYRDTLGFEVVGRSENHGPEQEALNHVPGARLRITTLKAASGPAIEFLEYLNPRDGRSYPVGTKPGDLVYWETALVVREDARPARPPRGDEPSSPLAEAPGQTDAVDGPKMTKLLRDPDGHAMKIKEKDRREQAIAPR